MLSHDIIINDAKVGKLFIETDGSGKYVGMEVFLPPALIAAAVKTDFKDIDFTH